MSAKRYSRRALVSLVVGAAGSLAAYSILPRWAAAEEANDAELMKRFEYLSANGNSNCSGAFMYSIWTMPPEARLRGSCCAPMDAHVYVEQVKALRAYAHIGEIPPDPYDIEAGLARVLMEQYGRELTPAQQAAYDYAMEHSNERGPCCCGCWRWYVYGGLAKHLIRRRGVDGPQVAAIWDLSSGCGGAQHHHG